MTTNSRIGWTDHTFNPWVGCTRVSPACDNCYAETLSIRTGHRDRWGDDARRDVTSDGYWRNPLKWNAAAAEAGRPALVFTASLADVFEDRVDLLEPRARLFSLIYDTPHLLWLLLTKRPQNVPFLTPASWSVPQGWPSNVWIGTTVEDQERAEERLDHLVVLPAPVRFVSLEPLLEEVDLGRWLDPRRKPLTVDWLITGGESGPGYRPLDLDHARAIREQADDAGVPFFFKQVGGRFPNSGGHLLDETLRYAWPWRAGDRSRERLDAAFEEARRTGDRVKLIDDEGVVVEVR